MPTSEEWWGHSFCTGQFCRSAVHVQISSTQHICMALLQEAAQGGVPEEGRAAAQALASAVVSQVSLSSLSFIPPRKGCGTDCSHARDLLALPVGLTYVYQRANVKGPG